MPRSSRAPVLILLVLAAMPAGASAATNLTIVADDDARVNVSPTTYADGAFSSFEPPTGNAFLAAGSVNGFAGSLRLEASNILTIAAPIDKAAGDLALAAPRLRFAATNPVVLDSGNLIFDGPVDSSSTGNAVVSVQVQPTNSVVFGGPVGQNDPLASLTVAGRVVLPNAVSTAGVQSYLGNATTPAGTTLQAGGALSLQNVTADGPLIATAAGSVSTGALDTTGPVVVSGSGAVTVPAVTASGLTVTAGGGGDVTLGSAEPTSANTLDLSGATPVLSAGRDLTVGLAGTRTYDGLSAPGAVRLATTGNLALTGRTAAGTKLALRSGGNITNTGTLDTPSVLGSAATEANLGTGSPATNTIASIGPFRSQALAGRFLGDITTSGDLITDGGLDLGTTGELALAHGISAGTLVLRGEDGIVQTAGAVRASSASLQATSGRVSVTAAGNDVDQIGAQAGNGAIDLRDSGDVELRGLDATSNVDARTTGNLRLTLPARGSDIVLAASGGFINDPAACRGPGRDTPNCRLAGAGMISSAGRWLVYAAASDRSVFNGLDSGTAPLWATTPTSTPPAAIAGTRYVFAEQPIATLTPGDRSTPVGTDATDTIAADTIGVDGARPAVPGAYRAGTPFTGTPILRSTGASADSAAGTYPITLTGVTARDGYLLHTATGTHTVTPCNTAPHGCPAAPAAPAPTTAQPTPTVAPCVSQRLVRLHVRLPRGTRRVTATVNGHHVTTRRTGNRRARVTADLRGQPPGRYRVRIVAKLANGRTAILRSTVLRTCRPGH